MSESKSDHFDFTPVRMDLIFSNWLFIWYIFYRVKFVKYNPKFAITFALFVNIIQLIFMILFRNSFMIIFVFFIVIFLMKVIPLWLLRKSKFEPKQILYSVIFFFIYLVWLFIVDNPIELLKKNICFYRRKCNNWTNYIHYFRF